CRSRCAHLSTAIRTLRSASALPTVGIEHGSRNPRNPFLFGTELGASAKSTPKWIVARAGPEIKPGSGAPEAAVSPHRAATARGGITRAQEPSSASASVSASAEAASAANATERLAKHEGLAEEMKAGMSNILELARERLSEEPQARLCDAIVDMMDLVVPTPESTPDQLVRSILIRTDPARARCHRVHGRDA